MPMVLFRMSWIHTTIIAHVDPLFRRFNKKHLKNVGPIRHCDPPHAALPFTRCRYCRTPPAHRCPRQQRQRVTEGTDMAPTSTDVYGTGSVEIYKTRRKISASIFGYFLQCSCSCYFSAAIDCSCSTVLWLTHAQDMSWHDGSICDAARVVILWQLLQYFDPGRGVKYCDKFVCFLCLSVCLSARKRTRPNFTKVSWRRCDTLSTSGFVDGVVFCIMVSTGQNQVTLCFEEVCQVAVPVGCRTTTVFGRVHRNAALGGKICYLRLRCWIAPDFVVTFLYVTNAALLWYWLCVNCEFLV